MNYTIFSSREAATKTRSDSQVTVSIQLRNPVRYPAINIDNGIFAELASVPEQFREIVRSAILSQCEAVLKQAISDNLTEISEASFTLDKLLSDATSTISGKLTKDELLASFMASSVGVKAKEVAKTNPSAAKNLIDWVSQCHSAKACKLPDSAITQLLNVLTKEEYALNAETDQWYAQVLATIETVNKQRTSTTVESAF